MKNFGGRERNYFSSGVQIIFDTATNLYGENGLNPKIGCNQGTRSQQTNHRSTQQDSLLNIEICQTLYVVPGTVRVVLRTTSISMNE